MKREREKLMNEKSNAISELEKKYEIDMKKMNKSHDLVVTSIKSEKKSEENMHQDTKAKMEGQKKLLREEIERLSS